MGTAIFDVIVVGRGPVGLAAAAFTEQLGMSVAVIERHRDLYFLPRAGHVDHEIVRMFQSVGVAEAMLADSYPTTEYVWVNGNGETLLEFDWGAKGISGYNSDYMQFQPVFETALVERIEASPRVKLFLGWEAQTLEERDGVVELGLARTVMLPGQTRPAATDERQTIAARYLIAADGAGSGIRTKLGIERDDLGFNEKWLVVDARKKRDISFDFDCGQICDPRRPLTVLPLGKRHRRWEWAMLPGESEADLQRPEMAWKLLAEQNITPDDVEIIRQLVYTFEARHAREWRRGRVLLAGDAAHTMPPFMGQGMCSGLRDAKNLAWKLDLVLRGVADSSLLDSYEAERSPHTLSWTLISLEAGKVPCTLDPEEARLRDERFRNGWMPPMPDFPNLTGGVISRRADGSPAPLAGKLALQAKVARNGEAKLFDDFFPSDRFVVVSMAGRLEPRLSPRQRDALTRIGTRFVVVGDGPDADAADAEGSYAAYFAQHAIAAIIHRPDFYVFGAVSSLAELPDLVEELLSRLCVVETGSPGDAQASQVVPDHAHA